MNNHFIPPSNWDLAIYALSGMIGGTIVRPLLNGALVLSTKLTGLLWDEVDKHLFEYAKVMMSLASAILAIVFTFSKLDFLGGHKDQLSFNIICISVSIISGALILFINFLYKITASIVGSKVTKLTFKDRKLFELLNNPLLAFYIWSRQFMFWLSAIQLLTFIIALIGIVNVAYGSFYT